MRRQYFTFVLVTFFVANCGVHSSKAVRTNLEPTVILRNFSAQSWRLTNNRFFLWPNDLSVPNLTKARAIGQELDDLDLEAIPVNKQLRLNREKLSQVEDQGKPYETNLSKIEDIYTSEKKEQVALEEEISKAEKELDKKNPKQAEEKIQEAKGEVARIKKVLVKLDKEKNRLKEEIGNIEKLKEPVRKEIDLFEKKQEAISERSTKKIEEISEIVEWFTGQPSVVTFDFNKDNSISAAIVDWNLGDDRGNQSFSTEAEAGKKPTIGNVKYKELGGVFEFDVYVYNDEAQTKLTDVYNFKIERVKYDSKDGRNFFAGDITRTQYLDSGKKEIRKGYAKLIDSNN